MKKGTTESTGQAEPVMDELRGRFAKGSQFCDRADRVAVRVRFREAPQSGKLRPLCPKEFEVDRSHCLVVSGYRHGGRERQIACPTYNRRSAGKNQGFQSPVTCKRFSWASSVW